MTMAVKRWYRVRRNQLVIFAVILIAMLYYVALRGDYNRETNLDLTRRYIEGRIQEALKEDKGTGCDIPKLDPFAEEVVQFDVVKPKVVCEGRDWVKCYMSECKVVQEILDTTKNIQCGYRDIIYHSDSKYVLGPYVYVDDDDVYTLKASDHVKIKCSGTHIDKILPSKWSGHAAGYRTIVERKKPPPGREKSYNVLILGFDSSAKNGFIRRMPKSYTFLREHLNATILNGYNIVGDGTPAALLPILTGQNELELPESRKTMKNSGHLDQFPFLFYKMRDDGYRTAYFEDMPWIGTFQYRFNGFQKQPADHYLRAFFLEESENGHRWWINGGKQKYCVGDTPQYKLMLNVTDQFFRQEGKKFGFTFIADITHDDFNMVSTSDDDVVEFLRDFKAQGRLKDTLLLVMGDHGPRYANVRGTLQGKLEERLPLMAIVLPSELTRHNPDALSALQSNVDVLTTPYDIHTTLLDVVGLQQYTNTYKVKGADLLRGMSLIQPVPRNRSCSEAAIEPHWCACLRWDSIASTDALYQQAAQALLDHINSLTETERSKCAVRTLTSIEWVMRQRANKGMLAFEGAKDQDGYVGKFGMRMRLTKDNFQVKIVVGPGSGIYEGSLLYYKDEQKFVVDSRGISRINAYNNEPSCISELHPHLNMYCYCKV